LPLLLDASAVMAVLRREAGAEVVTAALAERVCRISSLTLSELEGTLVGKGEYTHGQVQAAWGRLAPFVAEVPFDAACRDRAVFHYARPSPYPLSLGDAACLGTAEAHGLDVLTAERGWRLIPDLSIQIKLLR
jgi:ribonuclease VapC